MLLQTVMVRHWKAILAVICSLAPLRAATLERLSLDDLIQKSTAIVRCRVQSSYAAFRGNLIYTHYQVQVSEQLKGAASVASDILVPGGTANGVRQTYGGVPQLTEGKEYVLFLWAGKSGTQVIGFTQGVFDLAKDSSGQTMAVQGPITATLVDGASGEVMRNTEGIALRLTDLRKRISGSAPGATL